MSIKQYKYQLSLLPLLLTGCTIQNFSDFSRDFQQFYSTGSLFSFLNDLSSSSGFLYKLTIPAGSLIFLLCFFMFLFNRQDKFIPFLSLSGLVAAAVYLTPLLNIIERLPNKDILILQIRTYLLLTYFLVLQSWSITIFHHRRTKWIRYTRRAAFLTASLIVLLAWFQPKLLSLPWIVPFMALLMLVDSTICSVLSLKRENDGSAYGGILLSLSIVSVITWYLLTKGFQASIIRTMNHICFLLPAVILPIQFVISLLMIQTTSRKQHFILKELRILAESQKNDLKQQKVEQEISVKKNEEALRISSFDLKAARNALQSDPLLPLKLPEGWEGSHFISNNSRDYPTVAAWPYEGALLMAESSPEDHYAYSVLQMIRKQMNEVIEKGVSPVNRFRELNKSLNKLGEVPEAPLFAAYLQLLPNSALCATAGTAIAWYKNPGGKLVPVSSAEVSSTFQQGLGFRPYSREKGMPFRLPMEKGDILILTSRSLILREQELNGHIYGKDSLSRVLESHKSSNAQEIITAIIEDFDDFDMGNTRERQVYTAVIRKL